MFIIICWYVEYNEKSRGEIEQRSISTTTKDTHKTNDEWNDTHYMVVDRYTMSALPSLLYHPIAYPHVDGLADEAGDYQQRQALHQKPIFA